MEMDTMRTGVGQAPKVYKRKFLNEFIFFLIVIILALYFAFGERIWFLMTAQGYQAVFLDNGQVYFGKLGASGKWLKLSDIYYLQANQSLQQTSGGTADGSQNIELVKLGGELHGPSDAMYIERDKILFWENLKDDSKVIDAIEQYQTR